MKQKIVAVLILLITSYSIASAEPRQSGNWYWEEQGNEYLYAITMNSSDHILGQYCYLNSGDCIYLVGVEITCNEYPALINTDAGAVPVQLVCAQKYEQHNVMAIKPFDDIDGIIRQASYLGIAIPMQNDQFKVSRFSLSGSTKAIDRMRAATQRALGSVAPSRPRKDVQYY